MKKYNLGIVVSEYNYDVTSVMLERAKAQANFLEVNVLRWSPFQVSSTCRWRSRSCF